MEALLAFAATLVSLRLTAELLRRHRARPAPELVAWAGSLAAFALGSGALAWGAAAGWDDRSFRVYYLFGGLLTAALLGAGSLLRAGKAWAAPVALLYAGLAVGVALAMPFTEPVTGSSIPDAQAHLELFPARALAIVGNGLGTVAAVAVALAGLRRRPVGKRAHPRGRRRGGARKRPRRPRRGRDRSLLGRGRRAPLRRLRRPVRTAGAPASASGQAGAHVGLAVAAPATR